MIIVIIAPWSGPTSRVFWCSGSSLPPPILTAIFQVNLGQLVLIEAKDDGGGGDN